MDELRAAIAGKTFPSDDLVTVRADALAALICECDGITSKSREPVGVDDDAARLDWLDRQRGDDVQQVGHDDFQLVAHYWTVVGQHPDVRAAIDAASEALAGDGHEPTGARK